MKSVTKKWGVFFLLLLLMSTHYVWAAKLVYEAGEQSVDNATCLPRAKRKLLLDGYCRTYNIPAGVGLLMRYFIYDNPLQYKNKPLPNDLSEQDLSGFDFTGCQFTYTDLTDSSLAGVTLTHTTCDYQACFQRYMKESKLHGGQWYEENIPSDLKSIAVVYPQLNNNTDKARLLHIACGLSRLPFAANAEFYIQVQYWSCALLRLKQAIGSPYGDLLVCSLEEQFNRDADGYCWTTRYPQDALSVTCKSPHANFVQYLEDFGNGLTEYHCSSKNYTGLFWYTTYVKKSIKGLQKAYPMIRNEQLQKEACNIACALSKSYQFQQSALLYHYLFYQHRLIRLKKLACTKVKNNIYYSPKMYLYSAYEE